jgi:three-Cys-motif partner protein
VIAGSCEFIQAPAEPIQEVPSMGKKIETIWKIDLHTSAKHTILLRYWEAWLPIMATWNQRVLYIDGFAGPGKYKGGEDGSPLIALKAARDHRAKPKAEIVFIFIEKEEDRFNHLGQTVEEIKPTLPSNFKVNCIHGLFNDEMTKVFAYLDEQKKHIAPSFVFIDPFGFSHTPFQTIQRIMQNRRCEVLITFMYEEINRFLSHPDHPETYDRLFGTQEWTEVLRLTDPDQRRRMIHDIYRDQLQEAAGIQYVRSFEMLNQGNSTDYFLFFGSHKILGLEKMKEAMWAVDPSGTFHFSDYTSANQTMPLFASGPDFDHLKNTILSSFKGKVVLVDDLEDFVIAKTPFLKTHFRRQILAPMEKEKEIEIVEAKSLRRRGSFPSGTKIRFK